jgi:capsular exopolysaccharide synthesis family protein
MSRLIDAGLGFESQSGSVDLPISDYCEALFVRLSDYPHELATVGLTSCTGGEGVTTVAAQLAMTAARSMGHRVLLVDCNFGNPAIHRLFDVPLGPGLRDALRETTPVSEFLQPTAISNLSLLTAGVQREDSDLAFTWSNLRHVFETFHQEFGLVIVDLPPVAHGVPAGLGGLLDGMLLIVEAERIRWQVAHRTASMLKASGVNLLGVVMNKRTDHIPRWLYQTL